MMTVKLSEWNVNDVQEWGKTLKLPENEGIIFADIIGNNKLNGKAMEYITYDTLIPLIDKLSFGSKIIIKNELQKLKKIAKTIVIDNIKSEPKLELKTNAESNNTIDNILAVANKFNDTIENTDNDASATDTTPIITIPNHNISSQINEQKLNIELVSNPHNKLNNNIRINNDIYNISRNNKRSINDRIVSPILPPKKRMKLYSEYKVLKYKRGLRGRINDYGPIKQYGFIVYYDDGKRKEIFFHCTDVISKRFRRGDRVKFDYEMYRSKGLIKTRAKKISVKR